MKTRKERLFSGELSSMFRGVVTILIGSSIARIIGFATIPILTRIYTPEDYGLLALYLSFITVLSQSFSLRYVQAIPLPRSELVAFNLFILCVKTIFISIILFSIIFWLLGERILNFFSMDALIPYSWLIILGSGLMAFYELLNLWATRNRQYKKISISQFNESVVGSISKIGLGIFTIKPEGLILGLIASQIAGILTLLKDAVRVFFKFKTRTSLQSQYFLARYFQGFVWFRLPSQVLMSLSVQAPVLMSAALYSKDITGQLSLAIITISVPAGLIGKAISRAFYAEIAVVGKTNLAKVRRMTIGLQKRLFIVGIPIAIVAMLSVEHLFIFVFGEEWHLAGKYAMLLAPFMLFQFTSSPLMEVINITGSQSYYLFLHSVRVIGLVLMFYFSKIMEIHSDMFVLLLSAYLSIFYLTASLLVYFSISKGQ